MKHNFFIWLSLLALLASGCAQSSPSPSAEPARLLTVMTHDSFAISDAALAEFENQNQVKVQFLSSGDAGSAMNKAILARGNPLADVFYGLDNTFLSRALNEDIFEPYSPPGLDQVPEQFKLDPQFRVVPVDYGDVCLNYDVAYFTEKQLEPPQSLNDLLLPEYRGLLVVENPATSSPGLAFLLATISQYGQDGYLTYWEALAENQVKIVNDWETAYYTDFTRAGGQYPLVVSYSSSPAFEFIFADPPVSTPPTAAITASGTCFRQVEFVGILRGTKQRDLAEKWIDFMLSETFQADLPMQMFVFPVVPGVQMDEGFVKFMLDPEQPAYVSPAEIAKNRETWLQEWTQKILR